MDVAGRATYLGYRAGALAAAFVPAPAARLLARVGGRVAMAAAPARRRMAYRHQERVARTGTGGDVDRVVRGVFDTYARYWLEMFMLSAQARRGDRDAPMEAVGYEHLEAALQEGKGAILALPHLGGWEHGAVWMASRGHRVCAVVEPVEPPELFAWFVSVRRALGIEVVALGDGVAAHLLKVLAQNRIVCLLADRDLTGDGVEVEFFGERTTLPAGPAVLALRSGAPLLPVAVYFDGPGHRGVIRPPLPAQREGRLREDVARITGDLARSFEELIRAAPEQWHLLQATWPSDRQGADDGGPGHG